MNEQRQEDLVRETLGRYLDRDPKSVHGSDRLDHDLGMTTLDLVLVALHLEDLMAIELPIEKIEDVRTVMDLVRFIHTCIRQQHRAPRAPTSGTHTIDDGEIAPLGFTRISVATTSS